MPSAITVEDVSKKFRLYHDRNQSLKSAVLRGRRARYEEFLALDGVSFDVEAGTTFGLIGENGSGKSTMLKCMAKILRPDTGRISVDGKVSALLELGAGFHPELSGKENIYLNGTILGLPSKEIERKYDEIVEFAGLERFIDTPVKNYSSGMYVRLGFSVAINVDPDVLLVDEVLAVGDEQFQRRCNEKFAEMRKAEKTIVVVSHGLALMRNICDRVAWFEHGNLRKIGDAGEVIDDYISEVQTDRQEEEGRGSRWGSGEVQIEDLELLDASGRRVTRLATGDAVTLRIHYNAHERIEKPTFGIAMFNLDGLLVTLPSTRDAHFVIDAVEGRGTLDHRVDRLMLLPGTYDLSVSVYDHQIVHPYDYRMHYLRFDVDPGVPNETRGGVFSMGGNWVDPVVRS